MNYILFDTPQEHGNLLPLTFTRPIADLRIGIDTIRAKWEAMLPGNYSYITADYLSEKYPKCKFVVSHMENETREELKKKKIKNIIVPKDGEKIKI